MPNLDEYLGFAAQLGASDVHLKADRPPLVRINGDLIPTDLPPLSSFELEETLSAVVGRRNWDRFCDAWELDMGYEIPGGGRYRLNVFRQRGTIEAVLRVIPVHMRTMAEIGLPELAQNFTTRVRGLVLVTGPVGSGKSTTQAAMLDAINERYPCHIITVEDPIEFVHMNKKAIISQRELGADTASFGQALRNALREDPDVILVGEMRDLETVSLAITAAETGHLVISTLHTMDAAETINRIIDIFPTHQHDQVRVQVAANLVGVIGQTLVRRADGKGRIAAFEVMANTSAVASAIRDNKIYQIPSAIQTGTRTGMVSLDQFLAQLVRSGQVDYEEALLRAKHASEFSQLALATRQAQRPARETPSR
jgi:twitching motility protein PilT